MLKPYDEYKEISILWNKYIPNTWKFQRGKSIFYFRKDLNNKYQCDNVLSLTMKGVVNNNIDNPIGLSPKDYATYQLFEQNDLVFKLIDLENYKTSRVGLVHEKGIMSSAYIRLVNRIKLNHKYFYYQYYDLYLRGIYNNLGAGVRSTLNYNDLLNIEIFTPPLNEQDQIVKYLDWQMSKINTLINAKKKQIELLKEQKQAVINKAVTKGLDDTVAMKDSGVDWLGEVPEHWEIVKLTRLMTETNQKNRPDLQLLSVVREKGVIIRDIGNKEENHNFIPDDLSGYKVVKTHQFVMNKMKAWQGSYGISHHDGIVSPAYYIFNVNFQNLNFFHWAIRSKIYVSFFAQASDGIRVGQWDLSKDKMKTIPFFIPPLDEQQAIVTYLEEKTALIDKAISVIEKEIELVNEYKTSLISSVVTGKVDVRDVVVPDFEVVEEMGEDVENNEEKMEGE